MNKILSPDELEALFLAMSLNPPHPGGETPAASPADQRKLADRCIHPSDPISEEPRAASPATPSHWPADTGKK